jgi:hypothetical protein
MPSVHKVAYCAHSCRIRGSGGAPKAPYDHPYYPTDLLIEGYVPPQLPFEQVLAVFFASAAFVFAAVWLLSGEGFFLREGKGSYCYDPA